MNKTLTRILSIALCLMVLGGSLSAGAEPGYKKEIIIGLANVFTTMDEKEGAATGHWGMEQCVRRTNHPTDLDQLFRLAKAYGSEFGLTVETREQLTVLVPMLQGQDSFQRYEWMSRRIEEVPGKIDVEQAVKILATGPVYCDATLHSWVFDPKNRAAYLSIAGYNPPVTATDRPFTKIDLTEWFK